MSSGGVPPVRVAIVNDYEVVVRGLVGMLHPFRERVIVVEGSAGLPPFNHVDIVLFDTFSRIPGDGVNRSASSVLTGATKVVVFAWSEQPDAVAQAFAQGAAGYLSKGLDAGSASWRRWRPSITARSWPSPVSSGLGRRRRLAGEGSRTVPREAEVLAYLVRGLTRQEIAAALYVSINTVKTTLSSVYRKIGVEDPARHGGGRPQAVQSAIENGFVPKPKRLTNPTGPD